MVPAIAKIDSELVHVSLKLRFLELPKGEKLHKQVVYQSLGSPPPPPAHPVPQ